ncbi:MAG: hypothetical protein K5924_06050 [Chloroflexi bacterium]|nr:hypothetical protein [Chloroflexota bacterium]
MTARDRAPSRRTDPGNRHDPLSIAVDLIRRGETVLTLIDPRARGRDPDAFSQWLRARLTIAELPRLIFPECDARCAAVEHDPDMHVVLSDIALDPAAPRRPSWWADWNDSLEQLHQSGQVWYAGAPAMPVTPLYRRLAIGTRLRRIASTDPAWVAYDRTPQETLYHVEDGPRAGSSLVAVTFGPAPLLPTFAGVLIAPDHPPVHDARIAIRLLAAGWSAVERGLPYEE